MGAQRWVRLAGGALRCVLWEEEEEDRRLLAVALDFKVSGRGVGIPFSAGHQSQGHTTRGGPGGVSSSLAVMIPSPEGELEFKHGGIRS